MTAIYLDYNATTPCDPRVVEKMLPYFGEIFGNPANALHRQGRLAARAMDDARAQVAALIGAREREIIFTSGATESNNLAILGFARMNKNGVRKRIVTSAIEHKAVLLACKKLTEEGFDLVVLPVDKTGVVSLNAARDAIDENTLLVSVHAANNEVGVIQPIAQLTELAHQCGALVHCDAAQAVGKIPAQVDDWNVDMLSISAHKIYGPKGVGALFIRGGVNAIPLEPLWYGGGQEGGLRSGTSNVPGIVGMGVACQICQAELESESARIRALRDDFEARLIVAVPSVRINGAETERLPNTSSLTLPGIDADALILNAPEIMIGTGSACTSGAVEPSHVLTALGLDRAQASSTVRVSLGRFTQPAQIPDAVHSLANAARRIGNL
ncbi:MAG: cysteine desulfurase family protein [Anaerolineales bacterium]